MAPEFLKRHQVAVAASVVVAVAIGFFAGRTLASNASADRTGTIAEPVADASGVPNLPGPDETPVPGTTPDVSRPYWDIPYLNQDRLAPKFHGTINGLELGATSGPILDCAQQYRSDWQKAIAGSGFATDFSRLPAGMSLVADPEVVFCEDGRPLRMEAVLQIREGTDGASASGGLVVVSRAAGVRWWRELAPAGRWSAGTVNGHPAVFLDQPVATSGESAVFVVDSTTNGSTRFKGLGTTLELTRSVAEALTK